MSVNKTTSSERTGKFKQIHESSNCLLTLASFKTLPSSPLLFLLSMWFTHSALTSLLRVLRETCILIDKQIITWCQTERLRLPSKPVFTLLTLGVRKRKCSLCSDSTSHTKQGWKAPDYRDLAKVCLD